MLSFPKNYGCVCIDLYEDIEVGVVVYIITSSFPNMQLQEQAHAAAIKFERAHSEHESAKETLRIAEEGITSLEEERRRSNPKEYRARSPGCQIDEAWQETLTNATERVCRGVVCCGCGQ